jgi:hypothetical protein
MSPNETPGTQAGLDLLNEHTDLVDLDTGLRIPSLSRSHATKHILAIEAEAKAQEKAASRQEVEQLRRIAERWSKWACLHTADGVTRRSAARDFDESRGLGPAKEQNR